MTLFVIIRKNPFARFLLFYITGILLAKFIGVENIFPAVFVPGFLIIVITALMVLISLYPNYNSNWISGLFAGILLFLAGWINMGVQNRSGNLQKATGAYRGKVLMEICDQVEVKKKTVRAYAIVRYRNTHGHWQKHRQKILAYFGKDSSSVTLVPGNCILAVVHPEPIPPPEKPGNFNYKKFLGARNIYYRAYLPPGSWKLISNANRSSLKGMAIGMQQKVLETYRKIGLNNTLYGILSALTIGYKNDLEAQTKQLFSMAGVMHVMALSGFNVVIIAVVLGYLFYFSDSSLAGSIVKSIIIIVAVWFFAFITGLSPSVTRASAMITLVISGKLIHKQIRTINILFVSAFMILSFSSRLISDISFQLSFAAVMGIIIYQPFFSRLLVLRNLFLNKLWQLSTVSFAAQLATFPLTIYYFNQFPVYFWLTNLYVVPLVTIIICVAGVYLAVAFVKPLMMITGKILVVLLNVLYKSIAFTEVLPCSVIENIRINGIQTAGLIGVLLFTAAYITHRRLKYLIAALIMFIFFQIAGIAELLVMHKP